MTAVLAALALVVGVTFGALVVGPSVYRWRLERTRRELLRRFEARDKLIALPDEIAERIAESVERHPSQYVFPDRGRQP